MKKRIENVAITEIILPAVLVWGWGWFIFFLMETILKFVKGSSPWTFMDLPWTFIMIAFVLLLYSGAGIVLGGVFGGGVALLLRVATSWQRRIKTMALIMACSITVIIVLYISLSAYNLFQIYYPKLPPIVINLAFIVLSVVLFCTVYSILAGMMSKTKLIASFNALSITLYTFVIGGLSVNTDLLSGKFSNPYYVRIMINLGLIMSCAIIYALSYFISIFVGKKNEKAFKVTAFSIPIIILLVLITLGLVTTIAGKGFLTTKGMVKSGVQGKPSIILITLDTTRADHLSCYGYHKNTSPYLDRLAGESLVFKNAYAPSPWTLPSHASLLTGMYPTRHNTHWHNDGEKVYWYTNLDEHYTTLAEILADNGYRTAGVIGAPFCHSQFGLAQGFEYYDDALINVVLYLGNFTLFKILTKWPIINDIAARNGLDGCRIASQVNKRVFSWLEKNGQSPFFLFINYFDAHFPYVPPNEFALPFREAEKDEIAESERIKRYVVSLYDGEIAYIDSHLGKLFEKLKKLMIYDNTMIIITADHGEFFGEHDCWGHGYALYEEVIKVPLIIKYPSKHEQRGVRQERVSLVDIMPTILNLLALPPSDEIQGVDLLAGKSKVMAEIYGHRGLFVIPMTPVWEERYFRTQRSLYLGNYKYIKDMEGEGELYDIARDTRELHNLINIMPKETEQMDLQLTEWFPYGESPLSTKTQTVDEVTRETLRTLGYIQ